MKASTGVHLPKLSCKQCYTRMHTGCACSHQPLVLSGQELCCQLVAEAGIYVLQSTTAPVLQLKGALAVDSCCSPDQLQRFCLLELKGVILSPSLSTLLSLTIMHTSWLVSNVALLPYHLTRNLQSFRSVANHIVAGMCRCVSETGCDSGKQEGAHHTTSYNKHAACLPTAPGRTCR